MKELLKDIETYNKLKLEIKPRILEVTRDKSIPIFSRWEIFEKSYSLLDNKAYGDGFVEILGKNITLYDDFHIDRNQTTSYLDLFADIVERGYIENLDEWKELVLQSGYGSFTYDW